VDDIDSLALTLVHAASIQDSSPLLDETRRLGTDEVAMAKRVNNLFLGQYESGSLGVTREAFVTKFMKDSILCSLLRCKEQCEKMQVTFKKRSNGSYIGMAAGGVGTAVSSFGGAVGGAVTGVGIRALPRSTMCGYTSSLGSTPHTTPYDGGEGIGEDGSVIILNEEGTFRTSRAGGYQSRSCSEASGCRQQ